MGKAGIKHRSAALKVDTVPLSQGGGEGRGGGGEGGGGVARVTNPSFRIHYKPRPCLCVQALHHTDYQDSDVHVLDGGMPALDTSPACTVSEVRRQLPAWWLDKHIHTILANRGTPRVLATE